MAVAYGRNKIARLLTVSLFVSEVCALNGRMTILRRQPAVDNGPLSPVLPHPAHPLPFFSPFRRVKALVSTHPSLIAAVLNGENQEVLPLVLRMASDPVPNIRFNVSKTLEKMAPRLEVCEVDAFLLGYAKTNHDTIGDFHSTVVVLGFLHLVLCSSTRSLTTPHRTRHVIV